MLLTAVDEGLGACFFGIPPERIDAFRAAFGVPGEFRPVGCVSVGYPGDDDRRSPSLRRGRRAGRGGGAPWQVVRDGRVLVTGGSRGIGRAIARAFAEQGDRVAVHWGSSRDRAEQVLAELPGRGHVLVQADMADAGAVGAMVDRAAAELGGLDVLVNNAGVFTAHPPLTTVLRRLAGRLVADPRGQPRRRRRTPPSARCRT